MEAQLYQPDPAEEFAHKCLAERDLLLERVRVVDDALHKVHAEAMRHANEGDGHRKLPETADLPVLVRDTSECGGGEQLREPYIDVKPVDACYAGPSPWTGKPDKLAVTF